MTSIPGYYTQAELLAALGMSRQNFHQSGLAKVLPTIRLGRTPLYPAREVEEWLRWLSVRRGWIALGLYPADEPLVPPGGKVPWWVATGEYEWECPVCGGVAIGGPDPDNQHLWCPVDGIIEWPEANYEAKPHY